MSLFVLYAYYKLMQFHPTRNTVGYRTVKAIDINKIRFVYYFLIHFIHQMYGI